MRFKDDGEYGDEREKRHAGELGNALIGEGDKHGGGNKQAEADEDC